MKWIVFLLTMVFTLPFSNTVVAQKKEERKSGGKTVSYLMTTGVEGYVPAIILTAAQMQEDEKGQITSFEIVVYGEAVKQFAEKTKGTELVQKAKAAGADIILCEFALKKFGIDKKDLPDGLKFVGNAFQYSFKQMKKKVYVLSV